MHAGLERGFRTSLLAWGTGLHCPGPLVPQPFLSQGSPTSKL